MGKRKSSGILLYRDGGAGTEVFLVFPGGPFWAKKDAGAWTIPKGEFAGTEAALAAAVREFEEETGTKLTGDFEALAPVVQKAGKQVFAFALKGDIDAAAIQSNTFKLEWPPKSGNWQTIPEIAKAAWFPLDAAREKINPAQVSFLDELEQKLKQP